MNRDTRHAYRFTAMAASVLAAFGSAYAAEDEVADPTKPSSSVHFGLGYVDSDNSRFGQYSGLNEKGGYGLLGADVVMRDDATGRWLRFKGRDLGLDSRELRFDHQVQGNWGYYIDFSQMPRFEPFTVNTAVTGIGSSNITIPTTTTAGPATQLKTERERLTLGFDKKLAGNWEFKATFRNEEKEGARIFARGTTGSTGGLGNFEFTPEPIDSTTRQIETIVGFTGERLQLSGGYYGTFYENKHRAIFITGGNALFSGANNTINPIALPPDNESHQLHVSGGYSFTPTARGTFKLAYARATQEDNFLTAAELAPTAVAAGVPAHLGGRVDTTLAQMGLSARPMPKLSVRANLRYEDRDDKTPLFMYGAGGATWDGNNEPRSIRTTNGKLEASYLMPMAFRLTGGVDYEEKKRNTSPLRVVTFRETTEETAYRVEMRRSVAETVTGALAYIRSEREGSPFILTTVSSGAAAASGNRVAPIHLADRTRDQVRLTVNWQAAEQLSLQFRVDEARDDYDQIHVLGIGPREGRARNVAVDAGLTLSEQWQATAWASRNETEQEQWQHVGTGTAGLVWAAALKNTGDSLGLGLRGKPFQWLEVGGDLSYSDLKDEYGQQRIGGAAGAVEPLPDINTRLTRLQVFGKYALRKNAEVRLDYIYDRFKTDDWTWTSFTFLDGTTLTQEPLQKVNFIGVSYYYRFQ